MVNDWLFRESTPFVPDDSFAHSHVQLIHCFAEGRDLYANVSMFIYRCAKCLFINVPNVYL